MKKVIHDYDNPFIINMRPQINRSQLYEAIRALISEINAPGCDNCIAYVEKNAIVIEKISNREAWIRRYLKAFDSANGFCEIHGNFTTVFLQSSYSLGSSLCSKKDLFDRDVGIAVATARALGDEIPDYI